jgi:GT2 family glycosyltransferase
MQNKRNREQGTGTDPGVPRVSILIVNWNGKHHLPDCLDSLALQTFRDFETILVDNGSTDGSVDFVRTHYPWVTLVPLDRNTGFSGGNNAALAPAQGEYLVTLNNDTRVDPGWLAELVRVADENPQVGMVASRICSFADPDSIDSLGVRICPDGMSRSAARRQRFSTLHLAPVEPILIPTACAALYKRAMIAEIGFFDDHFFAYCEDTDLGLRGRRAGWGALLARDAIVLHKYSGTGGAFSPFKLYLVERNHFWVALKNFPFPWLILLPYYSLLRYLCQARLVVGGAGVGGEFRQSGGKKGLLNALGLGIRDALAGMPRVLSYRRQSPRRLSSRERSALLRQYRMGFRELLDG